MEIKSDINKIILETIDEISSDKEVKSLIKESLEYERDIWNRHINSSIIKDNYEDIINKIIKE